MHHKVTAVGLRAAVAATLPAMLIGSPAHALDVEIVNQSRRPASEVYVMLYGGSSSDGQLVANQPKRLSEISNQQFALSAINGRIFFSYGAPVTFNEPPNSRTRFDKVEITYPGVANLTAVDFFGIPFKLEALNATGRPLHSLAFKKPTNTIKRALLRIKGARRTLVKTSSGQFARILSPQLAPQSYPSMKRYIRSLRRQKVILRGKFFGSPPASFAYSGRFAANGSISVAGKINGGAGQSLSVTGRSLASAIYSVNGPYSWGGAVHHVSDNDVYAVLYRDLLAGFNWGYLGGRYGNNSARWRGKPPFSRARKKPTRYATYNQYAAAIYKYSNAYGFSFSDTGPKEVQAPLAGAAKLRITILPDSR